MCVCVYKVISSFRIQVVRVYDLIEHTHTYIYIYANASTIVRVKETKYLLNYLKYSKETNTVYIIHIYSHQSPHPYVFLHFKDHFYVCNKFTVYICIVGPRIYICMCVCILFHFDMMMMFSCFVGRVLYMYVTNSPIDKCPPKMFLA